MSVDLQLDPALRPVPPIKLELLKAGLAAVASLTADPRLGKPVCVRICGGAEAQALNAAYRGIDKPTNVLSFPADTPADPQARTCADTGPSGEALPLGDLAVCWPVVEAEARAQGKLATDHFTHLYVHGLLHLLGFDHEAAAEAEIMEDLEVRILAQLGLNDPYQPCK